MHPFSIDHNWVSKLSPTIQDEIDSISVFIKRQKGEVIHEAFSNSSSFYQVITGCVETRVSYEDGSRLLFGLHESGDCFAETQVLTEKVSNLTSIARTNSKIRRVPSLEFRKLRLKYPEINELLLQVLCSKLAVITIIACNSSIQNIEARLATRLYYAIMSRNLVNKDKCHIELGITQTDMADMLGVNRDSVSKVLSLWASQGIIIIRYGKIIIVEVETLVNLTKLPNS